MSPRLIPAEAFAGVLCQNIVMSKVNVFEVKARLSEYLDRAARGDRIVIYRHNKPIAELRGVEALPIEPRPIGPLPGRPAFTVPSAFFAPLPDDEVDMWEGMTAAPLTPADAKKAGGRPRSRKRRMSRRKQ